MISAGVIAANLSWNAKNSIVGIAGAVGLTVFMVMPFNPTRDRFPIIPSMLGP
jgi:hypothetical protein